MPRLKRRQKSLAVVSVAFLQLPSAGRNNRQVQALNVVAYRSDCTEAQRIDVSSAARERNRRSYSATATKSNRRAACKTVLVRGQQGQQCPRCWSRSPANQPNPLSSGHLGAAGRQGHRQIYPLTTGKYAPGPSQWWARGGGG